MANETQAALWNGYGGGYWATHHERYARIDRPHLEALLASRPAAPGDAVLDVGCGCGTLTRELGRVVGPAGSVLGVDLSGAQLALARSLSADLPSVRFEQGDAQTMDLGTARFDAVVSQFGTMFFDDPAAAFGNLARALRPGGTLTLLVWADQDRNEWAVGVQQAVTGVAPVPPAPGIPGPFSLADPDRVRDLLSGAGFTAVELAAVDGPSAWGTDVDDAAGFIAGMGLARRAFEEMTGEQRAGADSRLRSFLSSAADGSGAVVLGATSWLVTARRG